MSSRPIVALKTIGCKVNQADTEEMTCRLLAHGLALGDESDADVVIVNSCAVTSEAERKVRKAVRRSLCSPASPHVIVTGCAAVVSAEELGAIGDRVTVETDRDAVPGRVAAMLGVEASDATPDGLRIPIGPSFRTRVRVKVQDGCDCHCAYCIVPTTRGMPRSKPLSQIVDDVERLAGAGVAEVVLTGVNLGKYEHSGMDLGDLIAALLGTSIQRLRLSSIEPGDVGEKLCEVMAASSNVMPHLHIPLQSGSNEVLANMGRDYDLADYAAAIGRAKEALPGLAVTTDILVGFPGEAERDHMLTVDALHGLWRTVSKLHVFPFSARPGTRAAGMAGHLSPEVISARAAQIRVLGDLMRADYMKMRKGQRAQVLVERALGGVAEGTSEDYLKVIIARRGLDVGDVVDVLLGSADGERVTAA